MPENFADKLTDENSHKTCTEKPEELLNIMAYLTCIDIHCIKNARCESSDTKDEDGEPGASGADLDEQEEHPSKHKVDGQCSSTA